jgi:hypothetical protein
MSKTVIADGMPLTTLGPGAQVRYTVLRTANGPRQYGGRNEPYAVGDMHAIRSVSEGAFSYHGKCFDVTAPAMDPVKDRGFYLEEVGPHIADL